MTLGGVSFEPTGLAPARLQHAEAVQVANCLDSALISPSSLFMANAAVAVASGAQPPMASRRSESTRKQGTSMSSMLRDAKGLALDLRQTLKQADPWDREVEFQKEALRRAYLQVIFDSAAPNNASSKASEPVTFGHMSTASSVVSSHSKTALDALSNLWLETTHGLLASYRNKLNEMDKTIAQAPQAHRKSKRDRGGQAANAQPPPGPTARRKLSQKFRTFVAQEEEFYRVLLQRLASNLFYDDVAGLKTLGIIVETVDMVSSDAPNDIDQLSKQRSRALPLVHKALIYFGDLARYRELYSDPHPTKEGAPPGRKRGKSKLPDGGDRTKNFTRAAECYHQARLLMPDDGNPSNQLAVLSTYSNDNLSTAYHYYRALAVVTPFATARINLGKLFAKLVARWFAADGGEPDGDDGVKFRAAFVALQGIYFSKERLADIEAVSLYAQDLFRRAVETRLLPSETLVKVAMMSISALWHARTYRPPKGTAEESAHVNLEPHLLIHVLSFYRILLVIGQTEVLDLVVASRDTNSGAEIPLAQLISAVFRRTVPALRILSKWLMGNLEYIARVQQRLEMRESKQRSPPSTQDAQDPHTAVDSSLDVDHTDGFALQQAIDSFWTAYADFNNAIKDAFPIAKLPSAREGGVWLEEDVDLLGFAPLRRSTRDTKPRLHGIPTDAAEVGKQVHPNEEELMRIAELQSDAVLVADSESSLVCLEHDAFVVPLHADELSPEAREAGEVAFAAKQIAAAFDMPLDQLASPSKVLPLERLSFEPDAEVELCDTLTEDDPVDLAMRIGQAEQLSLDGEDDTDEAMDDVVVYKTAHSESRRDDVAASHAFESGLSRMMMAGHGITPRGQTSPQRGSLASSPARRSLWPDQQAHQLQADLDAREAFEAMPNVTHNQVTASTSRSSFVPAHAAPTNVRPAGHLRPMTGATLGTGVSPSSRHALPQAIRATVSRGDSDLSAGAREFVSRSPQARPSALTGALASDGQADPT
ncbi:hypothetical protein OIV83_001055 [Microbotryomycetes sp. JL201]|nr:hypothetical protein OIV83_001055 [Microbotryomycetes sp. JL201]